MRVAGLLLAAGSGERFGGCKQLEPIGGKPLVRHGLEALAPLLGEDLHIVLGSNRELIRPLVEDLARVIEHRDWRLGLGSSIARGVGELARRGVYDGVLIALADQARLRQRDFTRLLQRFDGDRAVAAFYAGRAGAPAIFPAAMFCRLARLQGDRGASALLEAEPDLLTVALPQAEADIDRREDIGRSG